MATVPLCRAPRPLGSVCGGLIENGNALCRKHTGCDRSRRCEVLATDNARKVACQAWAVKGARFCPDHDPAHMAQQRFEARSRTTEDLLKGVPCWKVPLLVIGLVRDGVVDNAELGRRIQALGARGGEHP